MDTENLSAEDEAFLAECEEELKDRFTENDEEFMKVFNREPSIPPIIENWWAPNNHRNERRHNRRPYDRHQNRDRQGRGYEPRRYNNDNSYGPHRHRRSYY